MNENLGGGIRGTVHLIRCALGVEFGGQYTEFNVRSDLGCRWPRAIRVTLIKYCVPIIHTIRFLVFQFLVGQQQIHKTGSLIRHRSAIANQFKPVANSSTHFNREHFAELTYLAFGSATNE